MSTIKRKVWEKMTKDEKNQYFANKRARKEEKERRKAEKAELSKQLAKQNFIDAENRLRKETEDLFITLGWKDPSDRVIKVGMTLLNKHKQVLIEFISTALDDDDFVRMQTNYFKPVKSIPYQPWEIEAEKSWNGGFEGR